MKKTLLSILFLGATLFASAQVSTATYDTSGDDSQAFLVGNNKDIDDSSIAAITAGEGIVTTNNNFFGILANLDNPDDATGTFTFTVTTNSATPTDLNLTFALAKRRGNNASGVVTIGEDTNEFNYPSDGTESQGVGNYTVTFSENISVSNTTPATVVIALNNLENGSVTSGHAATFRLTGITIVDANTLSIDEVSNQIEAGISPNPIADSFDVTTDGAINSVELYSITGQLIKTFGAQASYSIADVAAGVYIVKVQTALGYKNIKVIKQ